jgi:hypothetical protein
MNDAPARPAAPRPVRRHNVATKTLPHSPADAEPENSKRFARQPPLRQPSRQLYLFEKPVLRRPVIVFYHDRHSRWRRSTGRGERTIRREVRAIDSKQRKGLAAGHDECIPQSTLKIPLPAPLSSGGEFGQSGSANIFERDNKRDAPSPSKRPHTEPIELRPPGIKPSRTRRESSHPYTLRPDSCP